MAKREEEERAEEGWKTPVLAVYGETMHHRVTAKESLQLHKHLRGPM